MERRDIKVNVDSGTFFVMVTAGNGYSDAKILSFSKDEAEDLMYALVYAMGYQWVE